MQHILTMGTIFCLGLLLSPQGRAWADDIGDAIPDTVVKIFVTYQKYDIANPWATKQVKTRSGYGCVLPGRKIITAADIVKDATIIEMEKNTQKRYFPARIEVFDYDLDLALLTVDDETFFDDLIPAVLEESVRLDQPVRFALFEDSKEVRAIPGKIVKIAVDEYLLTWQSFLLYKAAVNFEGRGGGWSEPVFSRGKLVGLTMDYSQDDQVAEIIPASIINRFLGAVREDAYIGVPFIGTSMATMRSPDFNRYLCVPRGRAGPFVRKVYPGSSASGVLEKGDVLLSLDGKDIDADGYYLHPEWGKMDYRDLIGRLHYPGDLVEVEFVRDGRARTESMELKRFERAHELVPFYDYRAQPSYLIVGGLVIQELTRDYLREWGKDWENTGNKKYLYNYFYREQENPSLRARLVILNKVIPDKFNIGYHDMNDMVLRQVNGRNISRLEDVAEALRTPEGKFHRFSLEESNQEIILPVSGLGAADKRMAENYRIDRLRNL